MQLTEFRLERIQSVYENEVEINLSDSGVHPYVLKDLLSEAELSQLHSVELGYGWTNGAPQLRAAVAALYHDRHPDEVVITNGSAEANLLLVMSQLSAGDELIVVVPNYLQIWGFAKAIRVNVTEVSLDPANGWSLDIETLEQHVTDKTKLITVCNPNNPTGALLSETDQQALVALAKKHDLLLHVDEIYRGSELDGPESKSFADLYDKAFVSAGLSKSMALPGLRIGWLLGPKRGIYDAWSAKDYTSITTNALGEFIATRVLEPQRRQAILKRSHEILKENRQYLTDWTERQSWCDYVPPKAGGMGFLNFDLPVSSDALADGFRQDSSVLLLPGSVFGLEGYIRIGIGAPQPELQEGLRRLETYVGNLG